ncbi:MULTISPECIES: hypothetical protein [Aphanizomenonaceae]|uniref:Uncharacterized protein n=1 Tax=Dolichospermum heterosporum TAC447 TaxID=747523 RepID=A0ABY5LUA2_9CYAN|nr:MULTISPECIES: hypothetical protein [Aphanizomenonaceae]MDK2410153.1 hypothetical protein [Aphanizomenon sp. 202]MDK2460804.1 hypothetical protein [Aphanizomenon sp. PH219]UUO13184.1 hypothetical protein NG743_13815 [Dolichospermum heterosporum TAC447]
MFPASVVKQIDENLKYIVEKIETENSGLLVLAARKFGYTVTQNFLELTIKESRKFNVLEEFIIRAGMEFNPPPTANDLASILGLDSVFVKSTIANLQSLQTLADTSQITVTAEGSLFYAQGSVPKPPYSMQIYAITDNLAGKITFQYESLEDIVIKQPDLAEFVNIEAKITAISRLKLAEMQDIIQSCHLPLHVPTEGKFVTDFKVKGSTQTIGRNISLFVVFDENLNKLNIEIRSGQEILEAATKKIEELYNDKKISLEELCQLSEETIHLKSNPD